MSGHVDRTSRPPDAEVLVRVHDLDVDLPNAGGRGRRAAAMSVLAGVSLQIHNGQFLAIVGPSGCGKSTLLRAIAGLVWPTATTRGRIEVATGCDGRPDVAWMPQRDSLLPWRRAMPNALLGARVGGTATPEARVRAAELFERFGLAGYEHAWPHELSGGMRQRLALLRTVLSGRSVLLLDEPFGALDALTRRSMNEWLASLGLADAGAVDLSMTTGARHAVILVTHDVDEAVTLADEILVLTAAPGRVQALVPVRGRTPELVRTQVLGLLGM